jgi:hypothetical protein
MFSIYFVAQWPAIFNNTDFTAKAVPSGDQRPDATSNITAARNLKPGQLLLNSSSWYKILDELDGKWSRDQDTVETEQRHAPFSS